MQHVYLFIRRHLSRFVVLSVILFLYSTLPTSAQSPNNSLSASDGEPAQAVFVDEHGNVGINTQLPEANLDIKGHTVDQLPNIIDFPAIPALGIPAQPAIAPIYSSTTSILIDDWLGVQPPVLSGIQPADTSSSSAKIKLNATWMFPYFPVSFLIPDESPPEPNVGTASIGVNAGSDFRHLFLRTESTDMPIIFETEGGERLQIDSNGITLLSGSISFPDGSTQATASLKGDKGDTGSEGQTAGPKGQRGPEGQRGAQGQRGPGAVHTYAMCALEIPVLGRINGAAKSPCTATSDTGTCVYAGFGGYCAEYNQRGIQ